MASFEKRHKPGSYWLAILKRRTPQGWAYVNIFDDPATRAGVQELIEFCTFTDRLCLAYWQADDDWREWLRKTDNPFRAIPVNAFVEKQRAPAEQTPSREPLRVALAAISIDNWTTVPSETLMPSDEFDMAGILLNVITASRQAGGITEQLLQMAALSSDRPSRAHPRSISMRALMEDHARYR
ncbi:MAG: hypothetical protein IPK19_12270 [Chloroflexi bacterium]|nr:hypothetical protein [Chloroflexota bacterium]